MKERNSDCTKKVGASGAKVDYAVRRRKDVEREILKRKIKTSLSSFDGINQYSNNNNNNNGDINYKKKNPKVIGEFSYRYRTPNQY